LLRESNHTLSDVLNDIESSIFPYSLGYKELESKLYPKCTELIKNSNKLTTYLFNKEQKRGVIQKTKLLQYLWNILIINELIKAINFKEESISDAFTHLSTFLNACKNPKDKQALYDEIVKTKYFKHLNENIENRIFELSELKGKQNNEYLLTSILFYCQLKDKYG